MDMGQGADGSPWGTTHVEGHVETAAQDRYPQVGDNRDNRVNNRRFTDVWHVCEGRIATQQIDIFSGHRG